MQQPGLYIHVPFCETRCGYCDFYSVTSLSDIPDYIEAALKEISLYGHLFSHIDTIYIGGGTPSLLSNDSLERIFSRIRKTFTVAADAEITMEVNPADACAEFLAFLRTAGVNRLNVGVQAFDDRILRFLGRRHSRGQALQAMNLARAAGFENVGLDLIYGIPDQSLSGWKTDLYQALDLDPEHLSCYQLNLEGDTPLARRYLEGALALPDENRQADFFMMTSDLLAGAGYLHYEVSNFARGENSKSRHNQKYWSRVPYLGIGPSAHSFCGQRRWWNHRSIKQYVCDLLKDMRPVEGHEELTLSQQRLETCILGMRTERGIPLNSFTVQRNLSQRGKRIIVDGLLNRGLIVMRDGFFKPTRRGLAVADRLARILS